MRKTTEPQKDKPIRYCYDCKHLGTRKECFHKYVSPVTGETQLDIYAEARRESELYCGRDARYFEPIHAIIESVGCSAYRFVERIRSKINCMTFNKRPILSIATDEEGISFTTKDERYYFPYVCVENALRSSLGTAVVLKLGDIYGATHALAFYSPDLPSTLTLKEVADTWK